MQQFTIPQFIDVEDKIIGPITTRQFIIMLSTFVIIAICYKLFDFELFIVVGISLLGIGGTFAFLKINGRPFHYFILNFVETFKRPGIRIWINLAEAGFENVMEVKPPQEPTVARRVLPRSRLAQLALIADTHGAYQGEEDENSSVSLT